MGMEREITLFTASRRRWDLRPTTRARSHFVGGTIERVVIDVSGDHCSIARREVLAYLARD
jgi:hypothetical protein